MDDQNLYRELIAWLRSHHPLVLSQWEGERRRREREGREESKRLQAPSERTRSGVDALAPDANISAVIRALQEELRSLGIGGGTPGITPDGAPCIHLIKKGVYGSAYEESVTLARIRDPGYRRHLKQVFG
jgi:hypothetical protein